jgi:hypothetical protein
MVDGLRISVVERCLDWPSLSSLGRGDMAADRGELPLFCDENNIRGHLCRFASASPLQLDHKIQVLLSQQPQIPSNQTTNMLLNTLSMITISALFQIAAAETIPHAAGAEGTVMGPVQFLWPADRPWSADADNTAPCGSNSGVTNRTQFPPGEYTSSIQNAKYAEKS